MSLTLNKHAYEKLFNEDIAWMLKQPDTLERRHIIECLIWLRDNKARVESPAIDALRNKGAAEKIIEWVRSHPGNSICNAGSCLCVQQSFGEKMYALAQTPSELAAKLTEGKP